MNTTKIEFADFSLNPIIGCRHKCYYCYARKLATRFNLVEDFEIPEYFPNRLIGHWSITLPKVRNRIVKQISPDKPVVFMVDMGDIMSPGVSDRWIGEIIQFCYSHPEAIFLFLTKNPMRYLHFRFPVNVWLGVTLDSKNTLSNRLAAMEIMSQDNTVFASIEPITCDFHHYNLNFFKHIFVGAMTNAGQQNIIPNKLWIESIKHESIFFKYNIQKYL